MGEVKIIIIIRVFENDHRNLPQILYYEQKKKLETSNTDIYTLGVTI